MYNWRFLIPPGLATVFKILILIKCCLAYFIGLVSVLLSVHVMSMNGEFCLLKVSCDIVRMPWDGILLYQVTSLQSRGSYLSFCTQKPASSVSQLIRMTGDQNADSHRENSREPILSIEGENIWEGNWTFT